MTFVKYCGLTEERDVALACELGAQAIGFVLWPQSPRFIAIGRAAALVRSLPSGTTPVGVFVKPTKGEIAAAIEAGMRVMQIHGVAPGEVATVEPPTERWIAASVDTDLSPLPQHTTVLLDAGDQARYGGTGQTIDWAHAAEIATRRRVLLAGGLTPANVGAAIRQVRPFGVDVSSGIEVRPGIKDAHAMRAFMAAVREADQ